MKQGEGVMRLVYLESLLLHVICLYLLKKKIEYKYYI